MRQPLDTARTLPTSCLAHKRDAYFCASFSAKICASDLTKVDFWPGPVLLILAPSDGPSAPHKKFIITGFGIDYNCALRGVPFPPRRAKPSTCGQHVSLAWHAISTLNRHALSLVRGSALLRFCLFLKVLSLQAELHQARVPDTHACA